LNFDTFFGYESVIESWEPTVIVFGHIFGLLAVGFFLCILTRPLPMLIYKPVVQFSCALGIAAIAGLPILGSLIALLDGFVSNTRFLWVSITIVAFSTSFVAFNISEILDDADYKK